MDNTLFAFQKYPLEQALQVIQYYISIGGKYNTTIALLFHTNSIYDRWNGNCNILYNRLINL